MAEPRSYYPSSPSDKRPRKAKHLKVVYLNYKGNVMKSGRARRLLLLLLHLHTFGWEHPDISSCQEVHHRLIALLHGEQLGDLHLLASAPSPSRCFPHLFSERLLLVFPTAAEAEEMLLSLGDSPACAAAPAACVVISESERL